MKKGARLHLVRVRSATQALDLADENVAIARRWLLLATLSPSPSFPAVCAAARLDLARRHVDQAIRLGVVPRRNPTHSK
jgi:hypothetical protein